MGMGSLYPTGMYPLPSLGTTGNTTLLLTSTGGGKTGNLIRGIQDVNMEVRLEIDSVLLRALMARSRADETGSQQPPPRASGRHRR